LQEPLLGSHTAGIYGYTHAFGGYAGSHAEYIRVPHADVDCFVVPDGVRDDQALFLSDAAPTGFMGADFCNIQPGDIIAVWGCGGVGQMAIQSAFLLGAERVIAIDRYPERLHMIKQRTRAETIDYTKVDSVVEVLKELTGGRGPDACIDAVGMEAHGTGVGYAYDRVKQALHLETDRGSALREAIHACRKGGTLSVLGVYGVMDKFPMGLLMNKGMTVRTAQQHGQAYVPRLLDYVQKGQLDPSYLATHQFTLEQGPRAYEMFKHKEDGLVRAVFAP
jgi:threonine dehydrogenase-like Zn-dependent dehydrogenase